MLEEFKKFIAKGNVMDLAVGIIIGGAFALITKSLIDDVVMPVVGTLFGGLDFSNYFIELAGSSGAKTLVEAKKHGAVLAYGNFITVGVNFVILAFIIFLMVRTANRLREKEEAKPAAPAAPPAQEVLLTEIRDLLREQKG